MVSAGLTMRGLVENSPGDCSVSLKAGCSLSEAEADSRVSWFNLENIGVIRVLLETVGAGKHFLSAENPPPPTFGTGTATVFRDVGSGSASRCGGPT
jgi:hypothetical protein